MAATKPHFLSTDTEYHSVSSLNEHNDQTPEEESLEPKLELGEHPQVSVKRSWFRTFILQFLSLLWLVPVVALLILNFESHVIGASAWCPTGRCWVEAGSANTSTPERRTHKFDKEDHNLLGVLQLVSKALEIWFELIAVALVYIVTMMLAGRKEGLPVGYLTRPSEFADIPGLLDPLLWTSLPRRRHKQPYSKRAPRIRIWLFIAMTLALCIICNLMGPATAVLVIPSLQWLDTPKISTETFSYLNSADPPSATGFAMQDTFDYECSGIDFENNQYSCAAHDWADKLDAWALSWVAAASEGSFTTITWEDKLTFTLNSTTGNTTGDYVYWVPNRQLVYNFNVDASMITYMSQGLNAAEIHNHSAQYDTSVIDPSEAEFDTYRQYNKSLQLQVQRNGPILGTLPTLWYDNTSDYSWTTIVDSDKALQCFASYYYGSTDTNTYYTKCIQDGAGWGPNTKYASFMVDGIYNASDGTVGPSIAYEVFSSDNVAYLTNGSLPSGVSEDCIIAGSVPDGTHCDWDAFFNAKGPAANVYHNVTTLRMTSSMGNTTAVFTVDYVAYFAFTNYTLDPSGLTNPLLLVQTSATPDSSTAGVVAVNPAWTLAAWSVDNGGTLPANRSTAPLLLRVMQAVVDGSLDNPDARTQYEMEAVSYTPVLQTLSMIEFETTNTTAKHITRKLTNDPVHPALYRNANMYVWAYGMSSRTAYMGVLVAILGVLVVLTQFVLGLISRRRYRSPTQLLVAALEHAPRGEFDGREHDEEEMARVRFHIKDAAHTAGKFSFHPPT